MQGVRLFTSESVTEGHPDKMCDQISDAILDDALRQDPNSRVACETCITTGLVVVGGEITTRGHVDLQKVVRGTIRDIGYADPRFGFSFLSCATINVIDEQSPDIAQGVDTGGAGDQGEGKDKAALSPKGEQMAKSMHVDPEKVKQVDPSKDNVINVV